MVRTLKPALLLWFTLALAACSKSDEAFETSPTERIVGYNAALRKELTDAPYGWKVVYFPNIDSLQFTNLNQNIGEHDYEPRDLGVGGRTFTMKFAPDGWVSVQTDETSESLATPAVSEYEIGQGMATRLSFTTFGPIHRLINHRFRGSADFFYLGKDLDGRLRFRTGSYLEVGREYMAFERIETAAAADTILQQSRENRLHFEAMRDPQLTIRQGDRVFFRSDYTTKTPRRVETMNANRYMFFLFARTPSLTGGFPKAAFGLGSGYTGTPEGLSFHTGLRFSQQYIFHDFERVGDKFVCELVKVYHPQTRTLRYVPRHLFPQGEITGMVAEINDRN